MNSLLVSWNFDNLTGSNNSGSFTVSDVSNNYSGTGDLFATSSSDFLLKEDIKTNKLDINFDWSIRQVKQKFFEFLNLL